MTPQQAAECIYQGLANRQVRGLRGLCIGACLAHQMLTPNGA
jgi:hypothetical protein